MVRRQPDGHQILVAAAAGDSFAVKLLKGIEAEKVIELYCACHAPHARRQTMTMVKQKGFRRRLIPSKMPCSLFRFSCAAIDNGQILGVIIVEIF